MPGFGEALLYMFKDDNQGPPSPVEVAAALACVHEKALFPRSAKLVGSTFDAFVGAVSASPAALASLPVVTAEIGDTWCGWCCSSGIPQLPCSRASDAALHQRT